MNQQNYQKVLEKCIEKYSQSKETPSGHPCMPKDQGKTKETPSGHPCMPKDQGKAEETPTLLLHSCCAPCSSYCLEYLSQYFRITVFYYNPNLYPPEEFVKRTAEQKRLICELPAKHKINFIEGSFEPETFVRLAKGLENEPEGGRRCEACYRLRLEETAKVAVEHGFDYFTTTLSISPLKNAQKLNEIGKELSEKYKIEYLYSDFKKKGGYQRSIELSKQYHLYRQDYCGCIFSLKERQKQKKEREEKNNGTVMGRQVHERNGSVGI